MFYRVTYTRKEGSETAPFSHDDDVIEAYTSVLMRCALLEYGFSDHIASWAQGIIEFSQTIRDDKWPHTAVFSTADGSVETFVLERVAGDIGTFDQRFQAAMQDGEVEQVEQMIQEAMDL